MAVKIVRQPNKIALIGAPTSAGAQAPGTEKAAAALRAAGLVERLQQAGYEVTDLGDIETQLFQQDDESPRVRNAPAVLAALQALKPRVEQATKSGALPLILGGDCTIVLGTVAGVRRYFKHVALLWLDRDADLNVPATTPSGRLDGMVLATATGRGAPELVRFWGESPLVREPEITLFGLDRLDPPERDFLEDSPMLRYTAGEVASRGAARAAEMAAERMHASSREFVLHFDVDVIAEEDFGACDVPGPGGLRLDDVRQALTVFARQSRLAAFEVAEFNPDRDPDGSKARLLVDLLVSALAERREILAAAQAAAEVEAAAKAAEEEQAKKEEAAASPAQEETKPVAEFPPVITAPQAEPVAGKPRAPKAPAGGERPAFIYQPPPPAPPEEPAAEAEPEGATEEALPASEAEAIAEPVSEELEASGDEFAEQPAETSEQPAETYEQPEPEPAPAEGSEQEPAGEEPSEAEEKPQE